MQYRELTGLYDRLEATAATNEKREILAAAFAEAGERLTELSLLARGRPFAAWEPDELGVSSSLAVRAIAAASGLSEERIEDWWRAEGDLGDAAALAVENRVQTTLVSSELEVRTVLETIRGLAAHEGPGSQERRVEEIAGLLADSEPTEARYVVRTIVGAMRLGVGEGTIRDAIAIAFLDGDEASRAVERAYEVTNDFRTVSEVAREEGRSGLDSLEVELFRPIKAMLARKAEGLEAGLAELERPVVEYKYDGMRTKIHVREGEVRLFTRRLADVTAQFPDVVEAVETAVDAERAILEAEIVGYDPETGRPIPFQEFSKRIKRETGIEELAARYPVTVHAFDLLYEGESLLETPLTERLERLEALIGDGETVRRAEHVRPDDLAEAEAFYEAALAAGQEGVVVKNPDAPYRPGSRVGYMRKVKPTMERLDLVVVGAKRSEGRKSDWLGRLRLACTDGEELREVGRLFSGLTDDELREITDRLEPLVEAREGRAVTVRPEVVIEVEYEEIQASETYDSGYALRFPRFGGFRTDLAPEDADGLERVTDLYAAQHAHAEGAEP